MNIVSRIQDFNADREPERLRLKYAKMRADPFSFLRGTCHLFYDRLPNDGVFRSAPLAWICGDLHLENFGSYRGQTRLVYFDINDFDEALLAPLSWDLARVLTSVWIGAGTVAIRRAEAHALCTEFLNAYASSLSIGKSYWIERDLARGLIGKLLEGLRNRHRPEFVHSRTEMKGGKRVLRIDGKKALAASEAERAHAMGLVAGFSKTLPDPSYYEVLDVARRIAGTGSLGVERYVLLVRGSDSNNLLDLKRAMPSSLAAHVPAKQPKWRSEAHRVASLQFRTQAVSMAHLRPLVHGKASYVLRNLQPLEDRVELQRTGQTFHELCHLLATLGRIVAWAHLRGAGREGAAGADELIRYAERSKWKQQLLEASEDCASRVRRDSDLFNAAYDAGVFGGAGRAQAKASKTASRRST